MMKLERVTVVHAVEVDGNNRETIHASNGAQNIRWEQGLVWFEDRFGKHAVPAGNVKKMTPTKDEKK